MARKATAVANARKPAKSGMNNKEAAAGRAMLAQLMQAALGGGGIAPPGAAELLGRLIDLCRGDKPTPAKLGKVAEALEEELRQTRIDANGGDRGAHAALEDFHAWLDRAVAAQEIPLQYVIMLGRLIAGAGLEVPETMRDSFGAALGEPSFDTLSSSAILPLLHSIAGPDADEFMRYDCLRSLLEVFPTPMRIGVMRSIVANPAIPSRLRAALPGFLLHRDEALSLAAIAALSRSPAPGARIALLRPLAPPSRHAAIDAWPARAAAAAASPFRIAELFSSICDSTGTMSVTAVLQQGTRPAIATVMIKADGIDDAMLIDKVTKNDVAMLVAQMKGNVPTAAIARPCLVQLLELGLACNLAGGRPVPFSFVAVAEALALRPLAPQAASSGELLEAMLAGQDQQPGLPLPEAIVDGWFEAGPALEALLLPLKSRKLRKAALLAHHLPPRRAFWTRICALSALVLKDTAKPGDRTWLALAQAGRQMDSGTALETVPLMQQIAELTLDAFMQRD